MIKQIIHTPSGEIPKKPETFDEVMSDVDKSIMPGILHWNHPNFFAYFGAGNAYPSVLGDMLSSGIAAIGFSWVRYSLNKYDDEMCIIKSATVVKM